MSTSKSKLPKQPTWTSLVLDVLTKADDFMPLGDIKHAVDMTCGVHGQPKCNSSQIQAALHWLRKHRAVDSVISDDRLFWFATPADDTRTKSLDERTPEDRPRKSRARKGPAPAAVRNQFGPD